MYESAVKNQKITAIKTHLHLVDPQLIVVKIPTTDSVTAASSGTEGYTAVGRFKLLEAAYFRACCTLSGKSQTSTFKEDRYDGRN